MKTVDTRGLLCPAPLIAVKRTLKETAEGESFKVLADNRNSFKNLCHFLKDNNIAFEVSETEGIWSFIVSSIIPSNRSFIPPVGGSREATGGSTVLGASREATGGSTVLGASREAAEGIAHFEKGDYIIAVTSDRMGEGDEKLGKLLMCNFIRAIKDLDKLPLKIVFYNRGVFMATGTSEILSHLKDLEQMGVELLLCSTCVNHYGLVDDFSTGILSDMYTIADAMASAGRVIRP